MSIWFLDRSLHFHRLAFSFTDYYRLLLLHCGLPFWQYKYTDFGIPPYILHWYYIITPSLIISTPDEDISSMNLPAFNSEKVFQRNGNASSKFDFYINFYSISFRFYFYRTSKVQNQATTIGPAQPSYPVPGIRSATQNQKRTIPQTKTLVDLLFFR